MCCCLRCCFDIRLIAQTWAAFQQPNHGRAWKNPAWFLFFFSGRYLKLLASLRNAINISASACYARLSRGEPVRRHSSSFSCTCSCLRFFLSHLLRSVVSAGTGEDWLSARLCADAVIPSSAKRLWSCRLPTFHSVPREYQMKRSRSGASIPPQSSVNIYIQKQRTSYFIKTDFWIFFFPLG